MGKDEEKKKEEGGTLRKTETTRSIGAIQKTHKDVSYFLLFGVGRPFPPALYFW